MTVASTIKPGKLCQQGRSRIDVAKVPSLFAVKVIDAIAVSHLPANSARSRDEAEREAFQN